jgi:hypothetical protein
MDYNTGQTYLKFMTQHYLMKRIFIAIAFLVSHLYAFAQADLNYYLPDNTDYNELIPTPKSVVGHEVGEWHITHDKLVYYFYELASRSSRVKVEKIGQTYEFRPLLNVIITSDKNHAKLEEIRLQHLKLTDPKSGNINISDMPVVIRLGYSVHGNEASGANAAMLTAYHLAAAKGAEIDEILQNCIILIDPSLNPDGLQRHSTWANEHKSKNLNPDENGREFNESWPGGRTNHYWFDLNRDWLLAQHPESIARLRVYHDWKPNVQTDHHEMGSDATFFFQPGIPSRKNPLIPTKNVDLTQKIATYHAAALDDHKRLYYSKESFDDFYFGKGSTYPDIQGGIGILFEQASVRGHLRETENGLLSFPFAIKNQFISSLSTIKASLELKDELLTFQQEYFVGNLASSKKAGHRELFLAHSQTHQEPRCLPRYYFGIKLIFILPVKTSTVNGRKFYAGRSYIIPLDQTQSTLVRAIFERKTAFEDSLFYDISAWNFDLSYNTEIEWVSDMKTLGELNNNVEEVALPAGEMVGGKGYAYAIDWNQYFTPGFLYALLGKGLIVKVAHKPFTSREGWTFDRGTLLIPVGLQNLGEEAVYELIEKYAVKYHVKVNALASGFSSAGIDLGSNNFERIEKPVIAMLVDQSVSGYEAGEVWHLLDQRYDMHQTMISTDDVDRVKLNRYNVLLLPGGSYSKLNAVARQRIKDWVKDGGTLVAWSDALRFLDQLQIADLKFEKPYRIDSAAYSYADRPKARGAQFVGGAIFSMELDLTHPLAYGYKVEKLPVFKGSDMVLQDSKGFHRNPFRYTGQPLLSGYVSEENLARIKNSPAAAVSSYGAGKVIALVDDPNFRAFWYGTNRLMMNAIFWGDMISTR